MKKRIFASVWDAIEDTREAAAKRLGITQPRLNDLLRGRIDKFSVDALVIMLTRVGKRVTLRIRKAA